MVQPVRRMPSDRAGPAGEHRVFVEGHHHFADERGGGGQPPQIHRREEGQGALHPELDEGAQAVAVLAGDLGVVVYESQPAENDDGEEGEQDLGVPLRPHQGGDVKHQDNQQPAHGGGALFAQNPRLQAAAFLGPVRVVLAELQLA